MRRFVVCALLTLVGAEASGACVCVIKVMYRYSNGAAICFAARYEDGECVEDQCGNPTDVWEYRTAKYARREDCPECRRYSVGRTLAAVQDEDCCAPGENAPEEDRADRVPPGTAPVPVELPVNENFDPLRTRTLPEALRVQRIGTFKLRTANKVAADFSSDSCLAVGRDIEVLAFRVRFRDVPDNKIIAYELRGPAPGSRSVPASSISAVRFEPQVGKWLLQMRISNTDLPQFRNKQVYVFQAAPAAEPPH